MKRLFNSRGSNLGQGLGFSCPVNPVICTQQEADEFIFPTLAQLHVAMYGIQSVSTNLTFANPSNAPPETSHVCHNGDMVDITETSASGLAPIINTLSTGAEGGVPKPGTLPFFRLAPAIIPTGEQEAEATGEQAEFQGTFKVPYHFSGIYQLYTQTAGTTEFNHLIQDPIHDFWIGERPALPDKAELDAIASTQFGALQYPYAFPSAHIRYYYNNSNPAQRGLKQEAVYLQYDWTDLIDGYNYLQLSEIPYESIGPYTDGIPVVTGWNIPRSDIIDGINKGSGFYNPYHVDDPQDRTLEETLWIQENGLYQENHKYSYLPSENTHINAYTDPNTGNSVDAYNICHMEWQLEIRYLNKTAAEYDYDTHWPYSGIEQPGNPGLKEMREEIKMDTAPLFIYAHYVDSFEPENFVGYHFSETLEPVSIINLKNFRWDYTEDVPEYYDYLYHYYENLTGFGRMDIWLGKFTEGYYARVNPTPEPGFIESEMIINGVAFRKTQTMDLDAGHELTTPDITAINEGFTDFTPTLDLPEEVPPA